MNNQSDWTLLYKKASEAYTKALYMGAIPTPAEKMSAAAEFLGYVAQFEEGGAQALSILRDKLYGQDPATAARVLIEMPDLRSLSTLSESILETGWPYLSQEVLKRLWQLVSLSLEDFNQCLNTGGREPIAMTKALLTQPSHSTPQIIEIVEATRDSMPISAMMEAIANWPESESESQLYKYMRVSLVEPDSTQMSFKDNRTVAAFYLGLRGKTDGIEFLTETASGDDEIQAAYACYYLSLLASPFVVRPLTHLLHSTNVDVVNVSMDAASNIGTPLLIEDLARMIERDEEDGLTGTPICDDAVRILRGTIGGKLNELQEEYVWGAIPERFTNEFKERMTNLALKEMKSLVSGRRYRKGQPLTLAILADDLASPHHGPTQLGCHNLKAITGEDYGHIADGDLIDNYEAILSWKSRAANPEPLLSTGWAYMGKPLPPPVS